MAATATTLHQMTPKVGRRHTNPGASTPRGPVWPAQHLWGLGLPHV